mmetsp:Transcript_6387/g.13314  ORF Transcript_6387/g.13314 Transcript_6387/m.13314 type:complete len:92 (+) Transcript_6387:84-359(+)
MGATGDKVKARYSFIYVFEDGQWKISHHHSSVMPEAILASAPAPVDEEPEPETEPVASREVEVTVSNSSVVAPSELTYSVGAYRGNSEFPP